MRSLHLIHATTVDALVAIVAGAGLALALPPLGLWPCMFIAMPWALFLLDEASGRMRRAMAIGFFFGLGYFGVAFHWIGYAFLVDAESYLWMMPFAVGGLSAFMASYWAIAFAAAATVRRWNMPPVASLPLFLAGVEWLRGYLFTGFPWAAPGLSADGMGGLLQLASVVGMTGLTYLLLMWAGLPYLALPRARPGRAGMVLALALLMLMPLSWLWGNLRLSQLPQDSVTGVSMLLVQPNISQDEKWRSDNAEAIFEKLLAMSQESGEEPVTHIIWPESAVPFLLDESKVALARIAQTLKPGQVLLSGAIRRQAAHDNQPEQYFTSIFKFEEDGRVSGIYDKWRLVPGGEYLPLAWLLEPLGFRKVVNVPESFSAGPGPSSFDLGAAGRAGLLICYEVIFPHDLVERDKRPNLLINVTNDGWFGQSTGPYQHLAQVRMRAVEQNLPVVRAANTGISAIIDGAGRVRQSTLLSEQSVLHGPLPVAGEQTLFARFGALAALLIALVLSAMLCWLHGTRELD